jgi:hypothetical protein
LILLLKEMNDLDFTTPLAHPSGSAPLPKQGKLRQPDDPFLSLDSYVDEDSKKSMAILNLQAII